MKIEKLEEYKASPVAGDNIFDSDQVKIGENRDAINELIQAHNKEECDEKVEILQKLDKPECWVANGILCCKCGGCKLKDYTEGKFVTGGFVDKEEGECEHKECDMTRNGTYCVKCGKKIGEEKEKKEEIVKPNKDTEGIEDLKAFCDEYILPAYIGNKADFIFVKEALVERFKQEIKEFAGDIFPSLVDDFDFDYFGRELLRQRIKKALKKYE